MPDGTANLDHLPDDPVLLKGIVRELLATVQLQQRQIEQLTHRLDLLLKRVYGPRADQLDPRQLMLFETPPAEPPPAQAPLPEPDISTTSTKNMVMVAESCPRICHARRKSSTSPSP
jgi:hypothetical protein